MYFCIVILLRYILGFKARVSAIKAAEFINLKAMKNVPPALKLALISVCVLNEAVVVDNTSEATAKKVVISHGY